MSRSTTSTHSINTNPTNRAPNPTISLTITLGSSQKQTPKKAPKKNVSWTEDTVDNESLNRRSSKVCCIYHSSDNSEECENEYTEDRNAYEIQPTKPDTKNKGKSK